MHNIKNLQEAVMLREHIQTYTLVGMQISCKATRIVSSDFWWKQINTKEVFCKKKPRYLIFSNGSCWCIFCIFFFSFFKTVSPLGKGAIKKKYFPMETTLFYYFKGWLQLFNSATQSATFTLQFNTCICNRPSFYDEFSIQWNHFTDALHKVHCMVSYALYDMYNCTYQSI